MVLLLIAVATPPGISFSLSSSVTSYNNQITFTDEEFSMGLFGNSNCSESSRYSSTPFDQTNINIKDVAGKKQNPLYKTLTDYRSMSGYKNVYLRVSGASQFDMKVTISYTDVNNRILDGAKLTLDPLGSDQRKTATAEWSDEGKAVLNISGVDAKQIYYMVIDVRCSSQKAIYNNDPEKTFNLSLRIEISDTSSGEALPPLDYSSNMVRFTIDETEYNGTQISDGHEFIEYVPTNPNDPMKGAIVISKSGDDNNSFAGKNPGSPVSTTISTDGVHSFKLLMMVGGKMPDTNTKFEPSTDNGFKVKITKSDGSYQTYPVQENGYYDFSFYVGTNGCFLVKDEAASFNENITIEVTGAQHDASPANKLILFIIFDEEL